jgi:hypothetical protein
MAQGNAELGLLGFPRAPLLPTSWEQVAGAVKLACSQVETLRWLLQEMLAMVGQDVLKLARVSLKMGRKKASLADFFWFFLFWLTPPLL